VSAVTVKVPAKVNLSLGVGTARADGYHPLATVYQAIGLYDTVTVRSAEDWSVQVRGDERLSIAQVPTDRSNIAVRAAELLAAHHGVDAALQITIDKGIPVAGGMAGGSADAAAVLVGCDVLWATRTRRADLLAIAADLGSDVPFALLGGTAIGSGRGEVVTPVMTRGEYWWVVLESRDGLSTPAVYAEFDALHAQDPVADPEIPDALLHALRSHDIKGLGRALSNDLQEPAFRLRPELRQALADGLENSAHGAIVSGSGPSCLFLCEGRAHAVQVGGALKSYGLGPVSFAPGPVPGARVIR
jgi:4-diphosphocytidyl-2-C-methyl-D-erythritol kinase